MDKILENLINLSHQLADPELDLAILGEGNTSASCEDGTFWVKASGSQLSTIDQQGFSRVHAEPVLQLLDNEDADDSDVAKGLKEALTDERMNKPSVETFLHALCLYEAGANWVGHTHPVSVMSILCSIQGAEPFKRHIFPDVIVVCGIEPAVVPYVDPGLPLARAVHDELRRYLDANGAAPKLMLMQNHGMVALGKKDRDVINISLMADKWAHTLLGTFTAGGPRYLSQEECERIETRPDEEHRRRKISALK